ncbi:MAG: WG repeat-containing protein [Rhodothermales bacterium]|nr:WG repeat-containing protein [Rhodothermales bacterium]
MLNTIHTRIVLAALFLIGTGFGLAGCQGNTDAGNQVDSPDADANLFLVLEEGKWGYMNQDGHLAIGPYFDRAWSFSDGRALIEVDGRFGYINRDGDTVIEPRYLDAWYYSNGLAPVQTEDGWAFIDLEGEVVVESEQPSTFVGPVHTVEQLDIDRVRVGELYGFRNAEGQIVIDPQFEQAWHFSDGLARIQNDGKWGYIDRSGQQIIEPRFDVAWDFERGLARVQVGDKYGYIGKDGEYVWAPTN